MNSSESSSRRRPSIAPPLLVPRLVAVVWDVTLVTLCCIGLFQAFNPVFKPAWRPLWIPAAIVLLVLAGVEIFTGVSIGKRVKRLTLVEKSGGSVPPYRVIIRGLVKYAPVILFLPTLAISKVTTYTLIGQSLFVLIGCYVAASYLLLFRNGGTLFDFVAGTQLVKQSASAPTAGD